MSNPYLSQIERGLRKPSADILQQLAKALRISAETLYVQAGMLDARERDELEVPAAILTDPSINERQKQVLIQIYESFRKENAAAVAASAPPPTPPTPRKPHKPNRHHRPDKQTHTTRRRRAPPRRPSPPGRKPSNDDHR